MAKTGDVIQLRRSAAAWGSDHFTTVLKSEIEHLDAAQLPLQAGLSHSSRVSDNEFRVMILGVGETAGLIRARAGIFYSGEIAGCSCADDPTPVDAQTEYCEIHLDIDRETGKTIIELTCE